MNIPINVNAVTLNRVKASVVFPSFREANIDATMLGESVITIIPQTEVGRLLPQATGYTTSLAPMILYNIVISLNRALPVLNVFNNIILTDARLGDARVTTDTEVVQRYTFNNCIIMSMPGQTFNGPQANYDIVIQGSLAINSVLYGGMSRRC